MKPFSIVILIILVVIFACSKEKFTTSPDASILLSADTIRFDTVFTSTGSVTQSFKIKNTNNRKLAITSLSLKGGAASPFRINVNGQIGPDVKDIEIDAEDSIYVFVSVTVKPGGATLPFIIRDSIEVSYNGNRRNVQLESWGQNANFLRSQQIKGAVTWTNKLPYVILGGLVIDSSAVLTIEKGCRIFCHADAPIIVDGTIRINGDHYDSTRVVIRGDRIDDPYRDFPASWPGIFFRGSSRDNVLNFAVIKNAYQALVVEQPSVNSNPRLTLNQCIVDNAYDAGLLAVKSSVLANNCLFSNCGKNIQLVYGGIYQFNHCTVVAYSGSFIAHQEPVLAVSNFIKQSNQVSTAPVDAMFRNCLFWGDGGFSADEVICAKQGNDLYKVNFQNCLWKVKTAPAAVGTIAMINNTDPGFDSINVQKQYYDFRLKASSPALDKGINTGLLIDLDGNPRSVNQPDLGAYER